MSPDERQLLTGLFDRIRSAAASPRDPEAEALISDAVRAQPYAPYLLAQAVIVQEQALKSANERLQQMDAHIKELEARAAQAAPQPAPAGGFLSGLGGMFGASPQPAAPQTQRGGPWQQVPQPGYAPQSQSGYAPQGYAPQPAYVPPQAGPWGSPAPTAPAQGGGFLHSALTTAAGVAGGVLVAESIGSMFGGHRGGGLFGGSDLGGGMFGSGRGGNEVVQNETIVNNYYGEAPQQNEAAWNQPENDRYIADASDDSSYDSGSDDSDFA